MRTFRVALARPTFPAFILIFSTLTDTSCSCELSSSDVTVDEIASGISSVIVAPSLSRSGNWMKSMREPSCDRGLFSGGVLHSSFISSLTASKMTFAFTARRTTSHLKTASPPSLLRSVTLLLRGVRSSLVDSRGDEHVPSPCPSAKPSSATTNVRRCGTFSATGPLTTILRPSACGVEAEVGEIASGAASAEVGMEWCSAEPRCDWGGEDVAKPA
mmetsp:Transcript_14605/g.40187  ORF Transcript_14605/g.40187 Transcript_14605/m.40187 type:complete len:216 (+) Transcript_14605:1553-2200(+)